MFCPYLPNYCNLYVDTFASGGTHRVDVSSPFNDVQSSSMRENFLVSRARVTQTTPGSSCTAKRTNARSANFDCPDLGGALIHQDDRQFARVLDRQAAEVVHDRLPLLDLPDRAVPRHGINAGVIHRADGRQQVGRVTAWIVERLDRRHPHRETGSRSSAIEYFIS